MNQESGPRSARDEQGMRAVERVKPSPWKGLVAGVMAAGMLGMAADRFERDTKAGGDTVEPTQELTDAIEDALAEVSPEARSEKLVSMSQVVEQLSEKLREVSSREHSIETKREIAFSEIEDRLHTWVQDQISFFEDSENLSEDERAEQVDLYDSIDVVDAPGNKLNVMLGDDIVGEISLETYADFLERLEVGAETFDSLDESDPMRSAFRGSKVLLEMHRNFDTPIDPNRTSLNFTPLGLTAADMQPGGMDIKLENVNWNSFNLFLTNEVLAEHFARKKEG